MRDWHHDTGLGDKLIRFEFACLLLLQVIGLGTLLLWLFR